MNMLDDDSENDSDYVPEEDPNYVPNEVEEKGEEIKSITFGRRKRAQELWDELQREDQQYVQSYLSKSISFNSSYFNVEIPTSKVVRKLKSYFGMKKTKTKKPSVPPSSSSKKRPREEDDENPLEQEETNNTVNEKDEGGIRQRAMEVISQIKKKSKVEEVRRFAGQSVVIEKTVLKSAEEKAEEENQKARQSAIDKALEAIKGPKPVSTVQKSAVDWDNFKEKEGIADEVSQAAAKNAYLQRKDFLERCDYRSFEKERDERLREIAKR